MRRFEIAAALLAAVALAGPPAATASFGGDENGDGIVDGSLAPEAAVKGSDSDQLIVSIGDSVASGEGNADVPGRIGDEPTWLSRQCHRSLRSGHAQAALQIERDDSATPVTFVPIGCSGATVLKGLLGPYDGAQPRRGDPPERPQIDRVNALAALREIDALLLSVGANDVHFSKLVRFCMQEKDCENKPFDPTRKSLRGGKAAKTLDEVIRGAIATLPGLYAQLDERLSDRIPSERVLILEYLDATTGSRGEPCTLRTILGTLDEDESRWARRSVVQPLNAAVREAADEHGWRLVDGVADLFEGHGICAAPADQRWVRTLDESLVKLNLNHLGTLHPNRAGHLATAQLIRPELADVLGIDLAGSPGSVVIVEDSNGWPLAGWLTALLAAMAILVVGGIGFALGRVSRG